VLEEKNAEIEELQARLSHLAAQAPNIQIDTERSRVALLTQVKLHSYIYIQNCTQFACLEKMVVQYRQSLILQHNVFQNIVSSIIPYFPVDTMVMFLTTSQKPNFS
jgi:hypothetical protein